MLKRKLEEPIDPCEKKQKIDLPYKSCQEECENLLTSLGIPPGPVINIDDGIDLNNDIHAIILFMKRKREEGERRRKEIKKNRPHYFNWYN